LSEQESRAIGGEPRDAAVNFDAYRIFQRHRAVFLPLTVRLSCWFFLRTAVNLTESSDKK